MGVVVRFVLAVVAMGVVVAVCVDSGPELAWLCRCFAHSLGVGE